MNKIFTLKSILKLAYLFNHNKLEFDTRFTDDKWTVIHKDSMMNIVVLDNSIIGQFEFGRILDSREYALTINTECKTKAVHLFNEILTFINNVIDKPELLDKFEK